jgi:hypothetical protein
VERTRPDPYCKLDQPVTSWGKAMDILTLHGRGQFNVAAISCVAVGWIKAGWLFPLLLF